MIEVDKNLLKKLLKRIKNWKIEVNEIEEKHRKFINSLIEDFGNNLINKKAMMLTQKQYYEIVCAKKFFDNEKQLSYDYCCSMIKQLCLKKQLFSYLNHTIVNFPNILLRKNAATIALKYGKAYEKMKLIDLEREVHIHNRTW